MSVLGIKIESVGTSVSFYGGLALCCAGGWARGGCAVEVVSDASQMPRINSAKSGG